MAWAYRQKTNTSTSAGTSLTITLPGVAAGSKLVLFSAAWVSNGTTAAPSAVSGGGATWREEQKGPFTTWMGNSTQGNQGAIWSADIASAGSVTVTVTWPASSAAQLALVEFTGLAAGGKDASASSGGTVTGN